MTVDPELLSILVCPKSRGALELVRAAGGGPRAARRALSRAFPRRGAGGRAGALLCRDSSLVYPIVSDIPVHARRRSAAGLRDRTLSGARRRAARPPSRACSRRTTLQRFAPPPLDARAPAARSLRRPPADRSSALALSNVLLGLRARPRAAARAVPQAPRRAARAGCSSAPAVYLLLLLRARSRLRATARTSLRGAERGLRPFAHAARSRWSGCAASAGCARLVDALDPGRRGGWRSPASSSSCLGYGGIDRRIRGPFSHYMTFSGMLLLIDLAAHRAAAAPPGAEPRTRTAAWLDRPAGRLERPRPPQRWRSWSA